MDDELQSYRQQFEVERKATEEARARRNAMRDREGAYDTAWAAVFTLFRRLDSDPNAPVDLEPLKNLAGQL